MVMTGITNNGSENVNESRRIPMNNETRERVCVCFSCRDCSPKGTCGGGCEVAARQRHAILLPQNPTRHPPIRRKNDE